MRKIKFLYIWIPALLVVSVPSLSQVLESEDEESGEEIIERDLYFHLRRAGGPGREVPPDAYATAVREHLVMVRDQNDFDSPTALANWIPANPSGMWYQRTNGNYIAGRTNVIAFHPTNSNILYLGAAGGGVWKTIDGGLNWAQQTDFLTSLACGAVAIDQNNPSVVYNGTGEQNYSGDSWYGDGIYKTTNAGTSWVKVATTAVGSRFAQIVVDPANSNIVYAAGSSGIYKSTNAGSTWAATSSGSSANCLIIDPANTQVLYTAVGGAGTNTIKKTTDAGGTWTTLTAGLPASSFGRTQLAIAPSNASILYASISSTGGALVGLYKTTDGGVNWTLQASSPNYLGSQGWYDNAICVHPTNPAIVVVAGLDVYTSSNSGVTLTQRTSWSTTTASNMSHADVHFLGYNGSTLYCGSDGGVYKSTNDGVTWTDLNATLSTLQFQSADYDPTNSQKLYGGTQDNNLETSTNGGALWIQRTTGDGGYSIVDPVTPSYVYGQYVQGSLKRSSNSGVSFTEIAPSGSTGGLFYNPYEMAPSDNNTVVYAEGDVWKTTTVKAATTSSGWTQIATSATVGGAASAIGISYTNPNKIYIGTSTGRILVTTNNGSSWTTTTGYPFVSDFAIDPTDDNVCYASFTGFTASTHVYKTTDGGVSWVSVTGNLPNLPVHSLVYVSGVFAGVLAPHALFVGTDLGVYKSTDDGTSWVSFNSGFPTVTVYDLKYHDSSQLLLAATHGRGCWTFNLASPLPIQLAAFSATQLGNGIVLIEWRTLTELNNYGFEVQRSFGNENGYQTVPNSFTPGHGTTTEPQYYSFRDSSVSTGLWFYRLKQIDLDGTVHFSEGVRLNVLTGVAELARPRQFLLSQNHPNPFNPGTEIGLEISDEAFVTLKVYDVLGQEVIALVNEMKTPGAYRISWDARNVPSGVYFCRVSITPPTQEAVISKGSRASVFTETRKMLLVK